MKKKKYFFLVLKISQLENDFFLLQSHIVLVIKILRNKPICYKSVRLWQNCIYHQYHGFYMIYTGIIWSAQYILKYICDLHMQKSKFGKEKIQFFWKISKICGICWTCFSNSSKYMMNRPGVAGVFLQTPSSLIN